MQYCINAVYTFCLTVLPSLNKDKLSYVIIVGIIVVFNESTGLQLVAGFINVIALSVNLLSCLYICRSRFLTLKSSDKYLT